MKFSEYQELAMRTASPISRATNDNLLMQAAMGLCGEIGEFIDTTVVLEGDEFHVSSPEHYEHMIKELGDIMWYAITGLKALGRTGAKLDLSMPSPTSAPDPYWDLISAHSLYRAMTVSAAKLIDAVKKEAFHGEGNEVNKFEARMAINAIVIRVKAVSYKLGSSIEEVMEKNIQKLRERYPEGFDADLSAHRKEGDV